MLGMTQKSQIHNLLTTTVVFSADQFIEAHKRYAG
jgi:hypothetical protein